MTKPQRLDAAGAADYLGVGERMIRRLVAERRIPFIRIGRHIRFDERDLDVYLAENRVEGVTVRRLRAVGGRAVAEKTSAYATNGRPEAPIAMIDTKERLRERLSTE